MHPVLAEAAQRVQCCAGVAQVAGLARIKEIAELRFQLLSVPVKA